MLRAVQSGELLYCNNVKWYTKSVVCCWRELRGCSCWQVFDTPLIQYLPDLHTPHENSSWSGYKPTGNRNSYALALAGRGRSKLGKRWCGQNTTLIEHPRSIVTHGRVLKKNRHRLPVCWSCRVKGTGSYFQTRHPKPKPLPPLNYWEAVCPKVHSQAAMMEAWEIHA